HKNGEAIALDTTLRQLKIGIANFLGIKNLLLPHRNTTIRSSPECNCGLAQSIATNGLWEMLRCRIHNSSHSECDYPHESLEKKGECNICHFELSDPCEQCQNTDDRMNDCPLVVNVGCNHIFHHHCYRSDVRETCPGGCSSSI